MILANPIYLWGLLGLAVPVAIHLWSRKEGKTIRMGSIRLLRESDPKQTSNIRISEWWLLLLRMLIVALIVLIMAGPRVEKQVGQVPVTYLIEESLLEFEELNALFDTLPKEHLRLLESGFPEFERKEPSSSRHQAPHYWQLAQDMQNLPTDSIVVFTNGFVTGFRGSRPKVTGNIRWVVLDPGPPETRPLKAVAKENEVELISLTSDPRHLAFEKEILAPESGRIRTGPDADSLLLDNEHAIPLEPAALPVLIFYDDVLAEEMSYIRSSYRALETFLDRRIGVHAVRSGDSIPEEEFRTMVWLSREPIVESEVPLLIYDPDSLAHSLIEPGSAKNVFRLTKELDTENIVEEHLPEQLLDLLDLHRDLDGKVSSYDRRVMSMAEILPRDLPGESNKHRGSVRDVSGWSWLFLLTLLLLERALARYRRQ